MKKSNEHGVSAVEFALLLPVLVLIIFVILEGGLVLYNQAVITNASREGARAGVFLQSTRPSVSEINTVIINYTSGLLITFGNGTVTPEVFRNNTKVTSGSACSAFGDFLRVTVSYPYDYLVIGNFGFGSLTLKASATMRCE